MPPYGPHRNPYSPPSPAPSRRARRLLVAVVPALVGAVVALAVVAATGNLGQPEPTTVVREPVILPAVAEGAPLPEGIEEEGPALRGVKSVQRIVLESAPAVVTVASGDPFRSQLGSGFLIDREGRILTNEHVLAEAGPVTVTFDDGTEEEARVLGRDASTDLAVLSVPQPPAAARPLVLGRSAGLRVGDPVVAIGNPFRLAGTTTTGIVSAVKRTIEAPNGRVIQNVVQTDAAINRGNSGGPLLDRQGRVIGINSQIATGSGGNDGVGFAVPIDTVVPVAESIILTGQAEHAWLGIEGRALTPAVAAALDTPQARGVAVIVVDDRGPAERVGLRAAADPNAEVPRGADLIVAVGGRSVEDMADVSQAVASRRVGDRLELVVRRGGERVELAVTLAERPEDVGLGRP